jgi:cation diffusion facilitator family transporter
LFHPDPTRERFIVRTQKLISSGQRIAEISFIANVFVGVFELGFGLLLGSLALSADGVHSFVDAVVSMTVWLGIRFSQRKADGRFHYGYYKFDAIFSLFAAIIMIASGLVIGYVGVTQYFHVRREQPISPIGGLVAVASIVIAVVLAKAKNALARKSGLVSLRTDAYNSVKDASASLVAFVGIFLTWFGFFSFDSIAGVIIGVFVMVAGYFAIKESSLILADAYSNPEMLEEITRIATSVKGIQSIDDLRVRRNGPLLYVEMHIRVDGNITVFEADRISQEVALRMRENIVSLGRITIKPEPAQNVSHKVGS